MITENQGIYDARKLGKAKFAVLGVQHLFAMFGATILVPLITGLDVSATLLFAGIGTLIFHFISQLKVPAFLGSSFAFLGGYASVKQLCVAQGLTNEVALDYACIGGVSLILYGMISAVGVRNLVEASVDFSSSRNVFVAALILVVSIGVQYGTNGGVQIGPVAISGLALAALVGIFLNAILPEQLGMKVKSFKGKDKSHLK